MRPIRSCDDSHLNTGLSKCPVDFARMKGAIIVPYGTKLPAKLTIEELTKLAHADEHERIYGIKVSASMPQRAVKPRQAPSAMAVFR